MSYARLCSSPGTLNLPHNINQSTQPKKPKRRVVQVPLQSSHEHAAPARIFLEGVRTVFGVVLLLLAVCPICLLKAFPAAPPCLLLLSVSKSVGAHAALGCRRLPFDIAATCNHQSVHHTAHMSATCILLLVLLVFFPKVTPGLLRLTYTSS